MSDSKTQNTRIEIDAKGRCVTKSPIVLEQAPPNIAGGDSEDCIFAGVIGWIAAEELDSNRARLEC